MVGVMRREHDCSKAIPQDVVDAFNDGVKPVLDASP